MSNEAVGHGMARALLGAGTIDAFEGSAFSLRSTLAGSLTKSGLGVKPVDYELVGIGSVTHSTRYWASAGRDPLIRFCLQDRSRTRRNSGTAGQDLRLI
jgi:hypothetical protein